MKKIIAKNHKTDSKTTQSIRNEKSRFLASDLSITNTEYNIRIILFPHTYHYMEISIKRVIVLSARKHSATTCVFPLLLNTTIFILLLPSSWNVHQRRLVYCMFSYSQQLVPACVFKWTRFSMYAIAVIGMSNEHSFFSLYFMFRCY